MNSTKLHKSLRKNPNFYDEEYIEQYRNIVIELLKLNINLFITLPEHYKRDYRIVKFAVKKDGLIIQFLDEEMKKNIKIIEYSLQNNYESYYFLSDKLKNDKNIIFLLLQKSSENYENYLGVRKDDYELFEFLVNKNGTMIKYASDRLKNNRELAKLAIQKSLCGMAYQYISDELKNSEELIYYCLDLNMPINFLDEKYLYNREIIKKALQKNGKLFFMIPDIFKIDHELVMIALETDVSNYTILPHEIKHDRKIILHAIKCGLNIINLDKKYLEDYEIISSVIKNNIYLNYSDNALKSNSLFVKRALEQYCHTHIYLTEYLKNKDIVFLCMKQGLSIKLINTQMKEDSEVQWMEGKRYTTIRNCFIYDLYFFFDLKNN